MRFRRLSALIRATANKDCKKLNGALLKKPSSHCASSSNALVQLQAHHHDCGEAASEDYLAAATFVSQRARRRPRAKLATRFRSSNQNAGPASATNAPPMNRTTPRPPSKDDEFGF